MNLSRRQLLGAVPDGENAGHHLLPDGRAHGGAGEGVCGADALAGDAVDVGLGDRGNETEMLAAPRQRSG